MCFSRTFKALNFDFQIQGLSRTFKVRANPVGNTFGLKITDSFCHSIICFALVISLAFFFLFLSFSLFISPLFLLLPYRTKHATSATS